MQWHGMRSLVGILFCCIHLIDPCSCNTVPADWRTKIHSSILTVLDSESASGNWTTRNDIIEDDSSSGMRATAISTGHLFPFNYWPNNGKCIPFKLHPEFDADKVTRQTILNAFRTIERKTHPCLTFKIWSNETEYISINPARHPRGCEADVGRTPGWITRVRLGRECVKPGIILHELLHALGFFHEHARSDRDDYLQIFPDNVESGKYDPNFLILVNMSDHGVQYDFESIMHYAPLAFAQNTNRPTMRPKVRMPVKMGQQEYLSAHDVIKLSRAYGCIDEYLEPVTQAVPFTCTVEHYLDTSAATTDYKHFQTRCNTLSLNGTATWLMRDADTMSSLDHTVITATVQTADGSPVCQELTATFDSFGEFSLTLPKNGLPLVLTFVTAGYYQIILRNVRLDGNQDVKATFMEPLLFVSKRFPGTGTATGKLYGLTSVYTDANLLPGANLDFRSGMNTGLGYPVLSITSSAGTWHVSLPAGHYTVTASKSGYITMTFTVFVLGGKTTTYDYMALSPNMESGQVRIVSLLKCRSTAVLIVAPVPHIRGPSESGFGPVHVHLFSDVSPDGFAKYLTNHAEIQSSMMVKQLPGVYRISVSDVNAMDTPRRDMATSCAAVQLYTGNKLWAEYFWPNRLGNAWNVVEINGTKLKPINEVNTVTSWEDNN